MALSSTPRRRWWQRHDRAEDRSITLEAAPQLLGSVVAGPAITDGTALRISDVWACVRALTLAASMCRLECYRETDDGRQPLTGGRGPAILREPTPGVSQAEFIGRVMQSLAIHGEAMLAKLRDPDGALVQLAVIDPQQVTVRIPPGGGGEPEYAYTPVNGLTVAHLGRRDIIHVKGMVDQLGLRGLSPIAQCREGLNLASNLAVSASATFENGAVPAGVVTVPAGPQSEEHVATLSNAWSARHQGPTGRGRVAVVNADVRYQAVTLSLSDQQFIETRKLSTQEICRIWSIPPSIIGAASGDSLKYTTVEQESTQFLLYSLQPWLHLVESAISLDDEVIPGSAAGCAFDFSELLRTDAATRASVATTLVAAGVMSVPEARRLNNLTGPPPAPLTDPAELQSLAQGLSRHDLEAGEAGG